MTVPELKLTDDESLLLDKDFHKISIALASLCHNGMVHRMSGNCISASELVCGMLSQLGIEASIVECQLTLSKLRPDGKPDFYFIGFDDLGLQGELDTHVVVVTKTKIPLIVDASISQYLPSNRPIIVGVADTSTFNNDVATINFKDYKLSYTQKSSIKLPSLHQKTILKKIAEEQKIKDNIALLRKVVIIIASFSLINFSLNVLQVILKIMNP